MRKAQRDIDEEFRGVCRQRRDGASPIRQDLRNLITWFKLTLDLWSWMMTMITMTMSLISATTTRFLGG